MLVVLRACSQTTGIMRNERGVFTAQIVLLARGTVLLFAETVGSEYVLRVPEPRAYCGAVLRTSMFSKALMPSGPGSGIVYGDWMNVALAM